MFRKIMLTTLSVFLLSGLAIAGNADSENKRYDANSYLGDGSLRNTYIHRVTSSGHIVNEQDGVAELGSPTYQWGKIHLAENGIITSTGVARHSEVWVDLPAKDQNVVYDGAAALTLATLVSGGTSYAGSLLTQPSVPRNIVVFASVTVGAVSMTSANITGTAYIAGLDALGRSTYTYQTVVTTANATVGLGDIAWSYISTFTIVCTSSNSIDVVGNAVCIQIGTGDNIGLANDIADTGDIYHVSEAGSKTSTYTADATYNTVNFATDGTGSNEYTVRYIQRYFTTLP